MKRINWTEEELRKLPKTREDAKALGLKHFFPGTPCKHGHISAKLLKGACFECARIRTRKCATRRRRQAGVPLIKTVQPISPGTRCHRLTATGGFKRVREAHKTRVYTKVYYEVVCDCGKTLWVHNNTWGEQVQCKYCHNLEMLQRAIKSRQRKAFCGHRSNSIEASIVYAARNRAKKTNLPFDLTIDDIQIPDCCPIFGMQLDKTYRDSKENNSRAPRKNAPSLDRIDPRIGYVKGNVMIISHHANNIKTDGSMEEHIKVAESMEKMGVTG